MTLSKGFKITIVLLAISVGIGFAGAAYAGLLDSDQQARLIRLFSLLEGGTAEIEVINENLRAFDGCDRPGAEIIQDGDLERCLETSRNTASAFRKHHNTIVEVWSLGEEARVYTSLTDKQWEEAKKQLLSELYPQQMEAGAKAYTAYADFFEAVKKSSLTKNIADVLAQGQGTLTTESAELNRLYAELIEARHEYVVLKRAVDAHE